MDLFNFVAGKRNVVIDCDWYDLTTFNESRLVAK